MTKKKSYIDLLAQHPKYVLFAKSNRIKLIYEPSKKQIRDRGKVEWNIVLVSDDIVEIQKAVIEWLNNREQNND